MLLDYDGTHGRVDPSAHYNEAVMRAISDGMVDMVSILLSYPQVYKTLDYDMALHAAKTEDMAKTIRTCFEWTDRMSSDSDY